MNQISAGMRMPANHIQNSWVTSCEPRVKSPALRVTSPRAEWCSTMAFLPLKRMSFLRMELFHARAGDLLYLGCSICMFAVDDDINCGLGVFDKQGNAVKIYPVPAEGKRQTEAQGQSCRFCSRAAMLVCQRIKSCQIIGCELEANETLGF